MSCLEHLSQPDYALAILQSLIKVGGTITVIEGDHGSTYFYPDSEAAQKAIQCQVELQKRTGGNANIGRELYPLLKAAGFSSVNVSPRMVYVDSSKPRLVEGFTKNTFTAMIEGVRESSIAAGLIGGTTFDEGIRALYRTTEQDGVFCYTFLKQLEQNEKAPKQITSRYLSKQSIISDFVRCPYMCPSLLKRCPYSCLKPVMLYTSQ